MPEGYRVRVTVRQEHAERLLFRLPLPIVARIGSEAFPVAVTDSLAEQTFKFSLRSRPDTVLIDPDNTILKFLTLRSE